MGSPLVSAVTPRTLRARRFLGLMPHRVREILIVASPFDAFILEEDGLLSEQVFLEFMDISVPSSPRFTHVSSGREALEKLDQQRFDLILALSSVSDMSVGALARAIKEQRPGRPVVHLSLDRKALRQLEPEIEDSDIDGAFLWSGDATILLAIIKFVEDRENIDHDIQRADVRVIVIVEDSPRYYSAFLGILYKELMALSRSLYAEGVDELERQTFIKSRPKVLHARTFEDGLALFRRYRRNVIALISDIGVPREGKLDPTAGFDLVRAVRDYDPDLPVLLQSAQAENEIQARQLQTAFLAKNSSTLLADLRTFLLESLGFGPFVFRRPDGAEIAQAKDLQELEERLDTIPEECFLFHAFHNHFSIWFMARSEFELAETVGPRKVADFPSVQACRQFLIDSLRARRQSTAEGVVTDFSRPLFGHRSFCRLGHGSLGGKARGIAFLYRQLASTSKEDFGGLEVLIPPTVVVTTDHFERFIHDNDLKSFAFTSRDDEEIRERFLRGQLRPGLENDLAFIAEQIDGPVAVRSSSLLEDSLHQRLAGIYQTQMIANRNADPEVRKRELCDAVKLVYASTFSGNAKTYLEQSGHLIEEEKMAVILQPVIGRNHGGRFYPVFSGVAQSYNYYPIGPQEPDDGIVHLALGLGRMIVEGGKAFRFSPRHPEVLPQIASARALLRMSQTRFWALDLNSEFLPTEGRAETLDQWDLEAAELDGALSAIASVYSVDDRAIREDLSLRGPRVITFNNILKHRALPLADATAELLRIAKTGLAGAVEIEFACDMGDWGRPVPPGRPRQPPRLAVLQIRPFSTRMIGKEIADRHYRRAQLLCDTRESLGHGVDDTLRDIVYVRRQGWKPSDNRGIAEEVGRLNERLVESEFPYILIGPGRWGSSDPSLGIPVQWRQISGVKVMIEASPLGFEVEPSQGTHFFQNITSQGVGYLTIRPSRSKRPRAFVDWDWLDSMPSRNESQWLRHVRLDDPLTVILDGQQRRGLIAKPKKKKKENTKS